MPPMHTERHARVADPARTLAALTRLTDRATRRRGDLPAPQVLLRAPGLEFAAGDRGRPFHAASVGKMMTATLAFRLAERGRLDLRAPLPSLLPATDYAGLFDRGGHDRSGEVTPMHLITHTSGVADYFEGQSTAKESFIQHVTRNPGESFTPGDLLAYTRDHQRAVGAPGERFHYSDTGYVLLGRLLEEAGSASLAAQLHEGIFRPAGMDSSCLMFHTLPGGSPPAGGEPGMELGIAPIIVDGVDLSRARSLSCDWGGGGVVTTVDDLHRFSGAWHGGDLIGSASRKRMTTISHRFRRGIHYGAGLMELRYSEFFPLLRGLPRTIGHLGVTGVHLFTDHASRITLAMNLHSTREMTRSFQLHIRLLQTVLRALR